MGGVSVGNFVNCILKECTIKKLPIFYNLICQIKCVKFQLNIPEIKKKTRR